MIRSALVSLALALPAGAFELDFPVACTLGESCFIQQTADHDPGPGAQDFTCGPLSYDGHDGTDIALPDRAAMRAGVEVLAAAPGTVAAIRDGLADAAPFPEGQDCGNGLILRHAGGWQTQYCHLREGSLAVHLGQRVTTGQTLGLIGQSGNADFPHLHLTLRRDTGWTDPFAAGAATCGGDTPGLWRPPLPLAPGGIASAGVTAEIPSFDAIKAGLPTMPLPADAEALVIWVQVFGGRAGDALVFTLTGPQGDILTEQVQLDRTQARLFRAVGKRLTAAAWPPGPYHGTARLMRGETEIDRIAVQTTLDPPPAAP
ncbi:M23 family metallopeptidase [Paracoccaceae bacterium]